MEHGLRPHVFRIAMAPNGSCPACIRKLTLGPLEPLGACWRIWEWMPKRRGASESRFLRLEPDAGPNRAEPFFPGLMWFDPIARQTSPERRGEG